MDDHGNTPLHIAVKNHHFKVVETLLEEWAEQDTENHKGYNPLAIANENMDNEIITLLSTKWVNNEPILIVRKILKTIRSGIKVIT